LRRIFDDSMRPTFFYSFTWGLLQVFQIQSFHGIPWQLIRDIYGFFLFVVWSSINSALYPVRC
jgi:hypothetical protein